MKKTTTVTEHEKMKDIISMFDAVSEAFDQFTAQEPYDASLSPEEKLRESVLERMVQADQDQLRLSSLRDYLRYRATYSFQFPNITTLKHHLEAVGFTVIREGRVSYVTI